MTEYIKKTDEQKRGTNFYLYYRQQAYQISHWSGLNYHEKHSVKNNKENVEDVRKSVH